MSLQPDDIFHGQCGCERNKASLNNQPRGDNGLKRVLSRRPSSDCPSPLPDLKKIFPGRGVSRLITGCLSGGIISPRSDTHARRAVSLSRWMITPWVPVSSLCRVLWGRK
ncbi:hypothetical protein BaRGS_00030639 [Batillaria attramentaria]|uniref:Uncharacterized protein n=1 Tax=Batillaria attramentaria TaxID=370345 RepID=A0ABD0JTW3_9CAEN